MDIPGIFLSNLIKARKHLNLSEDDINHLLQEYAVRYSELNKTISLKLAYYISKIFNKKIEDFIDDNFKPFDLSSLSITTQKYLKQKAILKDEDRVISKFINAYVIIVIKSFKKMTQFTNSDILPLLPPVLNLETSIDWTSGILKGLVKNTNTYRKSPKDNDPRNRGEVIYQLVIEVPQSIIDKAIKKVDPLWLKKYEEKLKEEDSQ